MLEVRLPCTYAERLPQSKRLGCSQEQLRQNPQAPPALAAVKAGCRLSKPGLRSLTFFLPYGPWRLTTIHPVQRTHHVPAYGCNPYPDQLQTPPPHLPPTTHARARSGHTPTHFTHDSPHTFAD